MDTTSPVVDCDGGINTGADEYAITPSVSSVAGGALLALYMYDDPVDVTSVVNLATGNNLHMLSANQQGDDALASAIESTSGGETGRCRANFLKAVSGGNQDIAMAISIRPH